MALDLTAIRRALNQHRPRTIHSDHQRAAVAAVLRGAERPELLLIERSARAGDPWSGQMAFPGGRAEPGESELETARRETREEVGLDLERARLLGRLDDQQGRPRQPSGALVISAFVFELGAEPAEPLVTSAEVESALWVPVADLLLPERQVEYRYPQAPGASFPGVLVGEPGRHVVWGLTYRFVSRFFEVLGRAFPPRA